MSVRRKIGRKVFLDVAPVQPQTAQPFVAEVRKSLRTFEQMVGPQPGQASESDLQTAGPIDASRIRILSPPMAPLPQHFVRKTWIARQTISLRQCHEMLMPVEFPRDLAVPDLIEIEKTHLVENRLAGASSVNRVQMPVNWAPVIQVFITEQVKMMPANFLGLLNDLFDLAWETLLQERQNWIYRLRTEKKVCA